MGHRIPDPVRDGRFWVFPDGHRLPVVSGGAVDKDDDDGDPDSGKDPKPGDDKSLGDAGKKAIDQERRARRDAERQLKEVQDQLKALTDKDKSEVDKLREEVATLTKERDEQTARMLRHEVALAKGLSAAQAKRLVGATQEELEADADEILEAFPSKAGATPPPGRKPTPTLRGGSDPTEQPEEMDPRKLAADLPRY